MRAVEEKKGSLDLLRKQCIRQNGNVHLEGQCNFIHIGFQRYEFKYLYFIAPSGCFHNRSIYSK